MNTKRDIVRRTRSQNAEFVIASIEKLRLQPHPQSRLMQMHRILTAKDRTILPNDPDFETALEADRDFQELGFVFEQAAAYPTDAEFQRLVRIALNDSVLPHEDRTQSKGRDAQFELFVAAICQCAGLHPVVREEPDVTCHIDDVKYAIAAKRVKNTSKLETRIRDAAGQIEKEGLPGIIALNTNVALNRDNDRITAPIPDDQFGILYKQALARFIDNFHERIQKWVRGKGVRGIVVHDQQVRLQPDGEWILEGMTARMNTARKNQRRNREFALFERRYHKGLPNVKNL